ncbi:MAG: hypothetical protein ACYCZN_01250 [Candidatus Dormibacteria bacterium]
MKLPNADDPVLGGVTRLRGLLTVIEAEPWMPRPTTEELEAAGFRKAASSPPPTFAEMMAVVDRRKSVAGRRDRGGGVAGKRTRR